MMDYLRMDTRIYRGQIEVRFLRPDRGKSKDRHRLLKWRAHSWYPMQSTESAARFAGDVARNHVEYLLRCYEIRKRKRKPRSR
jgi:hypothetical protein